MCGGLPEGDGEGEIVLVVVTTIELVVVDAL